MIPKPPLTTQGSVQSEAFFSVISVYNTKRNYRQALLE